MPTWLTELMKLLGFSTPLVYLYRIYYRVSGGEIWILHIRDARRASWEGK